MTTTARVSAVCPRAASRSKIFDSSTPHGRLAQLVRARASHTRVASMGACWKLSVSFSVWHAPFVSFRLVWTRFAHEGPHGLAHSRCVCCSTIRYAQVIQDLQYAARMLWRAPLFSGVAILTLSLCIGANSALFSVINAVLLRPLPFERADELYVVSSTYQGVRHEFTSFSDFADWRARSRVFTHMAAIRGEGVSITTPSGPEYLTGAAVSEDFFTLFSVQPFLGRTFLAAEHRPGHDRVVLLSHGLWLRRFGGDPAVVGTSVVLDGEPNTVVGVMVSGFAFPDGGELWRLECPARVLAIEIDRGRQTDIARAVGRGCVRASHWVRECRHPAPVARSSTRARVGGTNRARRRSRSHCPATAHRKRPPGSTGRRRQLTRRRMGHFRVGRDRACPGFAIPWHRTRSARADLHGRPRAWNRTPRRHRARVAHHAVGPAQRIE